MLTKMVCGGNVLVRVSLSSPADSPDVMVFPACRAAAGLLYTADGVDVPTQLEGILSLSGLADHWVTDPLGGPVGVVVFQLRRPPVDSEAT